MSNSPRGCRTCLVVIKPLSPCSNSVCCGRTHLAVVEPGSMSSSRVVHPPSPSIRTPLSQHRRPSLHPLGSSFPGVVGAEGGGVGRYVARTAHVFVRFIGVVLFFSHCVGFSPSSLFAMQAWLPSSLAWASFRLCGVHCVSSALLKRRWG